MKLIYLIGLLLYLNTCIFAQIKDSANFSNKPKISFTFDDGSVKDFPGYTNEHWNNLLLSTLEKHKLKSILFVKGSNLDSRKGEQIISSWNASGHKIANHTFSHKYFNSPQVTLEQFETDFFKNDSIIKNYSNFYPYFRFPFLKEGDTYEKVNGFRKFLAEHGYRNGYVTIDASDWYIDSRLISRLKKDSSANISGFKSFYISHLYDRALFYDSLQLI